MKRLKLKMWTVQGTNVHTVKASKRFEEHAQKCGWQFTSSSQEVYLVLHRMCCQNKSNPPNAAKFQLQTVSSHIRIPM
jgi:hypothetical protein